MKEQIMNTFATMGFVLKEVEGFGYGFSYEGNNCLYMPSDDDQEYLNFAIPTEFEVTEDNTQPALMLMDCLNSTLKYVKANRLGDRIWVFYERELYGGEDLEKLMLHMILHLEAAMDFFHNAMANIKKEFDNSDDDTSASDTEEAA